MSVHPKRSRAAVAAAASLAIAGLLSPATALAAPAPTAPPAALPAAPGEAAPAAASSLIISEYIEGSSFNKAIEIYNGTGAAVDLTGYVLEQYSNGAASANPVVTLSGSIADGDVHVLAHSSADPAILALADQTTGAGLFNGDDALVLRGPEGQVLDSFGQVGVDPGSSWGTPPTVTQDATLRRQASVCAGDTVIDDAFDPATEWAGFPNNTFDGLGSHVAECGPIEPLSPVINEFSIDTVSTDLEFYEIFGEPDTDYSTLSILQVEGDGTSSARGSVITVDAVGTTDSAGLWSLDLPANRVQNGTLTLLLVSDYTGTTGTVLDADLDGVIDNAPWTEVVDSVAILDENADDLIYSETALVPFFDGADFAPGGASRIPDGADTDTTADWVRNDFDKAGFPGFDGPPASGQAWNTPGEPNEVYEEEPPPPGGECGDPVTLVGAVQGSGAVSPLVGQAVSIEGTVVADFQDGSFEGFYLQDAGDGDAATSDGIFVYTPSGPAVDVGDQVRVTGNVAEFFSLTQIAGGSTIVVCATGAELPASTDVAFPLTETDLESFEGMRVTFPDTLSILEYFEYGRFGEVVIGVGKDTARQFQPTAVAAPGSPEAIAERDWNASHRITLDDHENGQNPAYLRHPAGGQFGLDHLFRGGDTLTDVTGIIDYRFDEWKVQPTQDAVFGAANPRPANAPDVGAGSLTVASFNVLNYFTDFAGRGADDQAEFDRQETKIVAAMAELDADILGLVEIENNGDVAVSTLTAALNAEVGAGTYDYIATGMIGTDEITTAFIFKPAEVTPVGDFATLTTLDDPRFLDDFNRPTLAQTFEEIATGETVTVAVNHLKSKGSDCLAAGDPTDPWAGNCNGVRTDAAEAMVDWLAADPTGTGSENTLIIGDINAYDKEDPINVFLDGGYTDLLLEHQGEHEYSYVFDGQLGYLDYALANGALAAKITGAAAWKINADEPSVLDYDMTFKPIEQEAIFEPNAFRSSDHDPILVGLDLGEPLPEDTTPPELTVDVDRAQVWPPNGKWRDVTTTLTATDDSDLPVTVTLVGATADGPALAEVQVVSDTEFRVRAVRGATYTFTYEAVDAAGNTTTASVTVTVPIHKGKGGPR